MYKYLRSWRYLRTRYIALASVVSVMLVVTTMIVVNTTLSTSHGVLQFSLFGTDEHPVINAVRSANLDSLTAEEIIALVARWQEMLVLSATKSKVVR